MSSSEISALRKQGKSFEALELARTEYPENSDDIWFSRQYAWALYDHVKNLVDAYESKQLSPTALSGQLTPYMREFAKIARPLRGDSSFSQMIRLAVQVSKDWQVFLGFARWAGISDFSEKDKAVFVNDQGKTIDSLQKRFKRAICREICRGIAERSLDLNSDQDLIGWGVGILEQSLLEEPNDQWLNYYQSKLHLANGQKDLAIKRLAPVLHRQSRETWPWALLGKILEVEQPENALTCYVHATQLAKEEQKVVKVRVRLAQLLTLAGRYNEAAQQAYLALQCREHHAYKVPQELKQLLASDWYQQAVANNSLQPMPKVESAARALLQALDRQNLIYTRGVIDNINTEKALSYVATGINSGFKLWHRKFPQIADLPPGTLVEVGQSDREGPPLDWRVLKEKVLPGLCETFAGNLVRDECKDFAFIHSTGDNIFVPQALALAYVPGHEHQVHCLAIRRTNKQGKTNWRAVKFIE